jgi:hypothetical protein
MNSPVYVAAPQQWGWHASGEASIEPDFIGRCSWARRLHRRGGRWRHINLAFPYAAFPVSGQLQLDPPLVTMGELQQ